ncbi:haloalkane dehalogenase [Agromyces sp. H66]|uniref:haloalkane dehalogenase n=1 Tax=Agromyces sp. H66 TaxID=2529859 RepID=UPI00145B886E|nr:haloalkane dehalogenase [Agromyces sp. H66]
MKTTLTHVGTATVIIEFGGIRFITDPVLDPPTEYDLGPITLRSTEGPALTLEELPDIDAVLLSHDEHVDNLDATGRTLLAGRPTVTTVAAAGRLGESAIGLAPWESTELTFRGRSVRVTAMPADHGDTGAEVIGFVLESPDEDGALYLSGDTVYDSALDVIGQRFAIGIAVLHLGAARIAALGDELITMDGAQAAEFAGFLAADVVVPIHFSSWDHFTEGSSEITAAFGAAGLAGRLRWLRPGTAESIEVDARGPFAVEPYATKKRVLAHGREMAVIDEGAGPAFVFVHGDIMSSYLWRNVLPHVRPLGRVVAVDLIGAGDSEKLPDSGPGRYSFTEHARYLDGLLQHLDLGADVTLIGHDWGSNLAIDWAMRNTSRVRGIVFGEAILPPFEWSDWPEPIRPEFEFLRTPDGERAVLEENRFLNNVQRAVFRPISSVELDEIARPYATPGEGRRPTLEWPRSVPLGNVDTPTKAALEAQADWMTRSAIPKLHYRGVPGAVCNGRRAETIAGFANLTEIGVTGTHWTPEDDPHGIGRAIADWVERVLR